MGGYKPTYYLGGDHSDAFPACLICGSVLPQSLTHYAIA